MKIERYQGALVGLAVGDALGTTLEFRPPGSFKPISDMLGGGAFQLQPGQWTDDTSMALCLATSLVEKKGFDPLDQMQRYVRWWQEGYWSSTGRCFDIGNTTSTALSRFLRTGEPYSGSLDTRSAGNGAIMRLAPVPLFFANQPHLAITYCAQSSRTTHAAPAAIDAARYMGGLIIAAIQGLPKAQILSANYSPIPNLWTTEPLAPEIAEIAAGSFKKRQPPEIKGSGYVVKSLEAALWAFYHTDNFRDGALLAVNLGDDADTTGAVYGQIAGTYYGYTNIPPTWCQKITFHPQILNLAHQLHSLATL